MKKIPISEMRFVPFTNDYGFKAAFGNEKSTVFLRRSLEALIGTTEKIKEIRFEKTEFKGMTKKSRDAFFDLSCVDEKGNSFIVEMQLGSYAFLMNRLKFYMSNKLMQLAKKGKYKFKDHRKVYCIAFTQKPIFGKNLDYYHRITLKNEHNFEIDNSSVFIIIVLDNFKLKESEVKTDLEKLIFMTKNVASYQKNAPMPRFADEEWMKEALEVLEKGNLDPDAVEWLERQLIKEGSYLAQEEQYREQAKMFQAQAREIKANRREIAATKREVEENKREIAATKREVEENKREIAAKNREVEEKNREVEEKNREVEEKNREVVKFKNDLSERDQKLAELEAAQQKSVIALLEKGLDVDFIRSALSLSVEKVDEIEKNWKKTKP